MDRMFNAVNIHNLYSSQIAQQKTSHRQQTINHDTGKHLVRWSNHG